MTPLTNIADIREACNKVIAYATIGFDLRYTSPGVSDIAALDFRLFFWVTGGALGLFILINLVSVGQVYSAYDGANE